MGRPPEENEEEEEVEELRFYEIDIDVKIFINYPLKREAFSYDHAEELGKKLGREFAHRLTYNIRGVEIHVEADAYLTDEEYEQKKSQVLKNAG